MKHYKAFTMVELLATIAILAILTAITITFVGNYITYAKKNVDKQNLYILNDALTRYKTQGGDLNALTLGAPIGNIIGLLQTPVTWAGMRHQFMRSGKTFDPTTIKAAGEGATYRFYVYDDYSENAPALGEATSDMPYGQGYGYVEVSGIVLESSPGFHMRVTASSGFWALLPDGESAPTITASNGWINGGVGGDSSSRNATFWACAGAADSTPAGNITNVFYSSTANNLDDIDVSGLTSLTSLTVNNCGLATLHRLPDSLQYLYAQNNALTSMPDISDNLVELDVDQNSITGSLSIVGHQNIELIECMSNSLTSVTVRDCPTLYQLACPSNNITSLTISNLPNLNELYAYYNNFTSISFPQGDDWSSLINIDVGDGSLTSLDVSHIPSLIMIYCMYSPLTSLLLPNQSMRELYVAGLDNFTTTTADLDAFYANELPDISGTTGAGGLYIGDSAPAGNDSLATAKGWTVIRADW